MPCLINPDMHHTWLCIMPCLCDGCLLYCLLISGLLLSLASVLFRSCEDSFDTLSRLLLGLVLLPCGISGKMTIPSKSLLSLLASCSLNCSAALPTTCSSSLPNCHEPLTFVTFLANHCLAMFPLLLSPSYSVASSR